jgi:hypothetical protein
MEFDRVERQHQEAARLLGIGTALAVVTDRLRGGDQSEEQEFSQRRPGSCRDKPETSMISKSQEETEVSLHLEETALEAEMRRLS